LRETKDYPADRIKPDDDVEAAYRAMGDHYAATASLTVRTP
jgi:hypothetical protein